MVKEPQAITNDAIRYQELGARTKFKEMVDTVLSNSPTEPILGGAVMEERQLARQKKHRNNR